MKFEIEDTLIYGGEHYYGFNPNAYVLARLERLECFITAKELIASGAISPKVLDGSKLYNVYKIEKVPDVIKIEATVAIIRVCCWLKDIPYPGCPAEYHEKDYRVCPKLLYIKAVDLPG